MTLDDLRAEPRMAVLVASLEAYIAAREEALRADAERLATRGHHAVTCTSLTAHGLPSGAACDCGWDEALRAHGALG
jgi:hypothetical protein